MIPETAADPAPSPGISDVVLEVILLDEPCAALDPVATAMIEGLMQELRRDYTLLIVTHNLQQASRVSSYTGFLNLGKLVEYGHTEEITGRFG